MSDKDRDVLLSDALARMEAQQEELQQRLDTLTGKDATLYQEMIDLQLTINNMQNQVAYFERVINSEEKKQDAEQG